MYKNLILFRVPKTSIRNKYIFMFLSMVLLCWLSIHVVNAAPAPAAPAPIVTNPSNPDIFTSLEDQFHTASLKWTGWGTAIGLWIFGTLATLELFWAAALWAMEKDSPSSLIVALTRKIMVLAFFYTFLMYAPTWIPAIINSLLGAGEKMAGVAATPGSLVESGLGIIKSLWAAWANSKIDGIKAYFLSLTMALILIPVSFIILFSFLFIAIELIITTIESYIVVGMGLVIMGFSGSQWTRDFSQKYVGYAFSVGVKLMVITLIAGTIITITNGWPLMVKTSLTGTDMKTWIYPMFIIAGSSVLMALLAIKIPSLASSLLSGAPSLGGAAAVGAAAGAAAGAAGLAVGASKLLGAGASAAGAVGGAATKGIAAAAVGGTGMAQAAGAASNLATASGFTPGSAAHAGATAGNMVAGLGGVAATGMSNMAGSAKSAISGAAKGAGGKFNSAVSNSTGGKLAASLNEKASGKQTSSGSQSVGGANTPSGGAASAAGSAATVPPPSPGGQAPGNGNNPNQPAPPNASQHLNKAMQQLPLDHGAVAAAAPKLDHHEP